MSYPNTVCKIYIHQYFDMVALSIAYIDSCGERQLLGRTLYLPPELRDQLAEHLAATLPHPVTIETKENAS